MTQPVKVLLTDAFTPLCLEIGIFGAMFYAEAESQFGRRFVEAAIARKVCVKAETGYGVTLYLAHKGRKLIGLTGVFKPSTEGLENAVCMRDAHASIKEAGQTVDSIGRQRRISVVYTRVGVKVLALARAGGYNSTVIRRTYRDFIRSGKYNELHLYSYLSDADMMQFGMLLLHPRHPVAMPIDSEKLFLYSLTPWPLEHLPAASEADRLPRPN